MPTDGVRTFSFDLGRACERLRETQATDVDADRLASPDRIEALIERLVDDFSDDRGVRLSGEAPHDRYVEWIHEQLLDVEGVAVETVEHEIDRWSLRTAKLETPEDGRLDVAGYVPFTAPTGPDGVEGTLVEVPRDRSIAHADVEGEVVRRRFPPGQIDDADARPFRVYLHDPAQVTASSSGPRESYPAARKAMEADLVDAERAGAAGVVFEMPYAAADMQLYLRPNFQGRDPSFRFTGGECLAVPAVFVGAAAGRRLRKAESAGSARTKLVLDASVEPSTTRSVFGRIEGRDDERLVVTTHTDGLNAVQENAGFGLVSLARYYAGLPDEGQPRRTIEFGFVPGHFYGRLGARAYAQRLAETGDAVLCLCVEHLGALSYRSASADGDRILEPTEHPTGSAAYVTPASALLTAVVGTVVDHDLALTSVVRADAPPDGLHNPPAATESVDHEDNFGGEAAVYHNAGLPVVNYISGNSRLLSFDVGPDLVDSERYHAQLVALADLLHRIDGLETEALRA